MKSIFTYISCCIILLTAVSSCTSRASKIDAGDGISRGAAESASRVIEYTNLIVDLSNSHNTYLKSILGNTDRIESGLKNPDKRFAFVGIIPPHLFTTSIRSTSGITIDKPVDELGKDDQAYFMTEIARYKLTFKKLNDSYQQLDDYLKAQDYKDDKNIKGYALIDTVRNTAKNLYEQKVAMMRRVNVIADAAEMVVLKSSPLKDYILAMKTDMKNIRNFVDMLANEGRNYTKISAQAQANYKALEASQAKNAALNPDNAKKANKESEYKRFYDGFHELLLHTKKTLRDAGEKGTLTAADIEGLDRDYDGLIRNYNYFNQ